MEKHVVVLALDLKVFIILAHCGIQFFVSLYRLTFTPTKSVVRLSRKDSYTPDPQLEQEVQDILSHKEQEEEQRLQKIDEEVNGHENVSAKSPPKEYHLTDIRPRRSRQFRSSVYVKVKAGEGKSRGRKMADED